MAYIFYGSRTRPQVINDAEGFHIRIAGDLPADSWLAGKLHVAVMALDADNHQIGEGVVALLPIVRARAGDSGHSGSHLALRSIHVRLKPAPTHRRGRLFKPLGSPPAAV
jgi:hypothetical protein